VSLLKKLGHGADGTIEELEERQ
jgi:hypothetical protein